ncbi:PREDICTED: uncharacterized protein LOC108548510 [Eufriesea mexicana]|uniref:uncharacterized protein LOC108548510 n=1 Tax=Eufriesea mexicana TaxID=516756 RepID=UPI00083BF5FC|nr:PREDICTED: uncharacterized protein LOC108548510 [Eufriesea mexicana]
MPKFIYFVVLIMISALAMKTVSRTVESPESMNGVQTPIIMTHRYPNLIELMEDNSDNIDNRICQIEYQVTRKKTGKCLRLGHEVIGCVSGDYMDLFHPDCF